MKKKKIIDILLQNKRKKTRGLATVTLYYTHEPSHIQRIKNPFFLVSGDQSHSVRDHFLTTLFLVLRFKSGPSIIIVYSFLNEIIHLQNVNI